jgi:hypothetical protein
MPHRPLKEIAAEIRADWRPRINGAAESYVSAMDKIPNGRERYCLETGFDVARGFLLLMSFMNMKTMLLAFAIVLGATVIGNCQSVYSNVYGAVHPCFPRCQLPPEMFQRAQQAQVQRQALAAWQQLGGG